MNIKLNALLYAALFSGLGLFSYLLLVNFTNLPADATVLGTVLFFMIAFNILGFSTIRLSSWINNHYALYMSGRWKMVLIYSAVAVSLLILNYWLIVCAKLLVGAAHPLIFPGGGIAILIVVWLVELVILGLLIANRSIKNTLSLQKQAAQLQQENDTARYTALQNQLNPHFLFNSLNTLIAEIEYEPRGAIVFTRNLSNVYRYVLQCQDRPLVTLGSELEFVRAYLFLHEVRLGNCLSWNSTIPDHYLESMMPPLTLQLLVENVIKHNSISVAKPMEIRLSVESGNLVVSNQINLKKSGESSGIGLQNLSRRCKLILGREITITNCDGRFTVTIPLSNE